ncbi:MAG TPA: EAL domain-containing protein [Candidatus Acidoferrales bacterium]|nr:EAL domain-containing protein [Candidatus Acidoferrales bacterium]
MNKRDRKSRILVIESDPAHTEVILGALNAEGNGGYDVEVAALLSEGIERAGAGGIEAILSNLSLPDSQGIATLDRLFLAAPHIPILILSGSDEAETAMEAVQHGAQDYVPKDHIDRYTLTRTVDNMIQRKAAEDALFAEKERAQVTLNSIGDAVLSTDVEGNVTYLNLVAESMTGWSREEALGRPLSEVFQIVDGATHEPAQDPLRLAIQQNLATGLTPNCILIRRDEVEVAIEDSAAPIHDPLGRVTGAVVVFHDVSAARSMREKMSHLAQHDFLTDLPNRVLLDDRLSQAIMFARRNGGQLAVLFLDLDHFKKVNDTFGHAVGDKLLRGVADRLASCLRQSDTISRQGGDEFVILLPRVEQPAGAANGAQKILSALALPFQICGHELNVSASMGISTYPKDGHDAETLLKSADAAMYKAKEKGRNNYQFFRKDMNARAVERQSLEDILRRALDRNEFLLHYQPEINLQTGEIDGVEVLLRGMFEKERLVPPLTFVPIAEECGLIVPIGEWVLREACTQLRAWLSAGLRPIPVSVNISAWQFRDDGFLESVRSILQETQLKTHSLDFELTESVLLDGDSIVSTLKALKAMGVRLAIDDFGTGYSSLSYLRRLPIDALKLDQSFVHEITPDPESAAIARAAISMGKSLKKRVIAEGVETREQFGFLQSHGCDAGQGYYFCKPVPAEQFAKLLRDGLAASAAR